MIETPSLTLRALDSKDIEPLYAIQGDRAAMRFTYAAPSMLECEHRLRTFEGLRETLGFAPWVAVSRTDSQVVGWGGLNIDPFEPGWGVEVSYFVAPAFWGRGFATEIVRAAVDHGFRKHSLTAIGAFAKPENSASIRVLGKCGFVLLRYEPSLGRNHYEIRRPAPLR